MKRKIILPFLLLAFFNASAQTIDFSLTKFECSDTIVKPGDVILIKITELLTGDSIPQYPNLLQMYLSADTILDEKDTPFCEDNIFYYPQRACIGFDHLWEGPAIQIAFETTIPYPYDTDIEDQYLIAYTDCSNSYSETNENNNILYRKIKVKGKTVNDFYIKNVSTSYATLHPHQEFNFSFDHCYSGNNESDIKPVLNFMYSRDSIWGNSNDDQLVHSNPWTGSNFNKSDTIKRVNWKLPLKNGLNGAYYLLIKTDWNDRHKETDENNNMVFIKIFVEEENNDFWISRISTESIEIQPGQHVQISCIANYNGNNASNLETTIQYFLSKDTILAPSDWPLTLYDCYGYANFSPWDNTFTNIPKIEIPDTTAAGDYYIFAKIIKPSEIVENDTTNNTNYCKATVTAPAIHDFYPININSPAGKLYSGGTFNTSCAIKYGGNSLSFVRCEIKLYLSTNSVWDENDISFGTISNIFDPFVFNTNRRTLDVFFSANLPYNLKTGEYYLIFKTDPDEKIKESNEVNNTISRKISVEEIELDFVVDYLKVQKDSVYAGAYVQTSSKLRFSSTSPHTAYSNIKLFLSKDSILHNEKSDSIVFEYRDYGFSYNNQEQTGDYTFILPEHIAPGHYYLILSVDDEELIDEINEHNNYAYTSFFVKEVPVHDFGIENISISKDTLKPQESLTLLFDQVYYGNSTEGLSSLYQIYFSADSIPDNSDYALCSNGCGSYGYSSSNPRKQCGGWFSIPTTNQPGNYYFIFIANYGNQVQEANKSNNQAVVPVVVESIYRDFSIDSLVVTPSSVPSGNFANIKVYCKNQGNEMANNQVPIHLRLSKNDVWGDSDDYPLNSSSYYQNVFLGQNKNDILQTQIFIPEDYSKGNYYLLAYIDANKQFTETGESNNLSSKAFHISGIALRDFFTSDFRVSDTLVHPTAPINLSYTHHYKGNSILFLTNQLGFYLSKDTIWDSTDLLIQNGGETYDNPCGNIEQPNRSYSKRILIPQNAELGIHYLILKADNNDQHQETNEENNTAYVKINIVEEIIDLSISQYSIKRDTVQNGGKFVANITGVLTGNTLNNIYVSACMYVSNDSILSPTDSPIGNSHFYLQKNNKSAITMEAGVPKYLKTGKKYLIVKIDEINQYSETDETNNVVVFLIEVQPAPVHDFYVCSAEVPNPKLQAQTYFQVNLTYCYGGNSIENVSTVLHFYFSKDAIINTDSDIPLDLNTWIDLSAEHPTIAKSYNFCIPESTTPGEYYILLVADSKNSFNETNEANNVFSIKVDVESRYYDFSVKSVTLSSDSLQKGGSISATYQFSKISNTRTQISIASAIYISTDSIFGYDDTQLDNFYSYFMASENNVTVENRPIKILDRFDIGKYFLLIKTDCDNQFNETDETNNVKVVSFSVAKTATRDFYIDHPIISTSEIQAGTNFNIKLRHKYNGNSINLLTTGIQFNLSKDSIWDNSDDVKIGTYDGLQNNLEKTSVYLNLVFEIPTATEPGSYHLLLKTDYTDAHRETNETNNVAILPLKIDEIVSDLSIAPLSLLPDSVQAGGFTTLNYDLKFNSNSLNRYYILNELVISNDSIWGNQDDVPMSSNNSSIGIRRTDTLKSFSSQLLFPIHFKPGKYHVLVMADSKKSVKESDETNNMAKTKITVLPKAMHDFSLSGLTLSIDTLQENLSVKYKVNHIYNGNSISEVSTSTEFRLSTDSIFGNTDDIVLSSNANPKIYLKYDNKSGTESGTIYTPGTIIFGKYYLFVKIDPKQSFQETDESNNVLATPVYIEKVLNDVFIGNIKVDPAIIQIEGSTKITCQINYTGNSKNYRTISVGAMISKDTLWDESIDLPLCSYSCGDFSFSYQKLLYEHTIPFIIPNSLDTGVYYILVKADSKNTLVEVNENNNASYRKIEITDKATRDFSITNLKAYKQTIYQDNSIRVSFDLNYKGNSVDLLSVNSTCLLSCNEIWGDKDDIPLTGNYMNVSKVSQNVLTDRCLPRSINMPTNILPGNYHLLVKADADQKHAETNEDNNIGSIPIEVLVRELDFFVRNLSTDADTVFPGSTVNLSGYYSLTSSSISTIYATDKYYLSSDQHFGNSDDRLLYENDLTINSVNPFLTAPILLPDQLAPGSYYIYAQLKSNYPMTDLNEENNLARTKVFVSDKAINDFFIDRLSAKKDSFQIGEPIEIDFDIHYKGNIQSAQKCHYEVRLTQGPCWEYSQHIISNTITLSRDSSLVHVKATLPEADANSNSDPHIMVKADAIDQYDETDKENNMASLKIKLTDYPKFDFSIYELTTEREKICTNSVFRCKFEISYTGYVSYPFTAKINVAISLNNRPGDADDLIISQRNICFDPLLGINKQFIELNNIFINDSFSPGKYTVFVYTQAIDNNDTDPKNNQASTPLEIVDQSTDDYWISHLTTTSDSVYAGNRLSFKYILNKKGNLYSFNNQIVYAQISADTIWDTSERIYSLTNYSAPVTTDTTRTEQQGFFVRSTVAPGNYYLLLKADANEYFYEANEKNNVASYPITIMPLATNDFYLSDVEITPSQIMNNQSVVISGKLHNGGNNPDFIMPGIKYCISGNDQPNDLDDLSTHSLYNCFSAIDSTTGQFSTKRIWITEPDPGSYFLIMSIDTTIYPELVTSNNVSATPFEIVCRTSTVHEFIDLCGTESYEGWSEPGDYKRELTSKKGCDSIVYTHIRTFDNPSKPTFHADGNCLLSSNNEGNQWYFENSIIAGAKDSLYMVEADGHYAVQTISEYGCLSEISDYLFIDYSTISELKTDMVAYPNPTKGLIYLTGLPDRPILLSVYHSNGKIISNRYINFTETAIDLSNQPSGMYLIKLNDSVLKVIKE